MTEFNQVTFKLCQIVILKTIINKKKKHINWSGWEHSAILCLISRTTETSLSVDTSLNT